MTPVGLRTVAVGGESAAPLGTDPTTEATAGPVTGTGAESDSSRKVPVSGGMLSWLLQRFWFAIAKDASRSLRVLGVVMLVCGLWRSWLQPALSRPLRATDLTFYLPFVGRHQLLSWGLLVSIAVVLVIAGLTAWGRSRSVVGDWGAMLAIASTVGFLMQSALVDGALQQRLRQDAIELTDLQLIVGYKIPRPDITTLGPIPLPIGAADVFSALRSGFYSALVGAVLVTVAAIADRRPGPVRTVLSRRVARSVTVVVIVALAAGLVQSLLAEQALRSAAASAARGDDKSAVADYDSAISRGTGLDAQPDQLAKFGVSQLRLGPADGPAAQLASSRLQLQAGKDLNALTTIAGASARWQGNTALRDEFITQAFLFLRKHGAPQAVRRLLSNENDNALLRIALSKYDLNIGDNPAALDDARAAQALAADTDVRSVALTYLSIAQSRSGNLLLGRQTLLAAVDADENYVNVMARSMLTGLYTTLPQ